MQLYKFNFIRRFRANCRKHGIQIITHNLGGKIYNIHLVGPDLLLQFSLLTVKVWRLNLSKFGSCANGMEYIDEIYHGQNLPEIGYLLWAENLVTEILAARLFESRFAKVKELRKEERRAA